MRQSGQESPAPAFCIAGEARGVATAREGNHPACTNGGFAESGRLGKPLRARGGRVPLAQCFQRSPTVGFATVKAGWGRAEAAEGCGVAVARHEVIAAQITHGLQWGAEQKDQFGLSHGDKSRLKRVWEAGLPGEGVRAHEVALRGRPSPLNLAF